MPPDSEKVLFFSCFCTEHHLRALVLCSWQSAVFYPMECTWQRMLCQAIFLWGCPVPLVLLAYNLRSPATYVVCHLVKPSGRLPEAVRQQRLFCQQDMTIENASRSGFRTGVSDSLQANLHYESTYIPICACNTRIICVYIRACIIFRGFSVLFFFFCSDTGDNLI